MAEKVLLVWGCVFGGGVRQAPGGEGKPAPRLFLGREPENSFLLFCAISLTHTVVSCRGIGLHVFFG